jgi:microcystin-dependent protein
MENLQIAEGINIDAENGSFYSPGDIIMLASNTAPDGFLECNGQTITQLQYPALFSILGTYYDTGGLVCKLPNINAQTDWIFPCCTVGNSTAYGGSSSHTHSTLNTVVTSDPYTTASHTHATSGPSFRVSNSTDYNHTHNGYSGAVGANNASNVANRSNGSGQGANLAISGHSHSWGYEVNVGNIITIDLNNQASHHHSVNFNISSAASNHSHSSTLTTSSSTDYYILNNVISMRYYIKW